MILRIFIQIMCEIYKESVSLLDQPFVIISVLKSNVLVKPFNIKFRGEKKWQKI